MRAFVPSVLFLACTSAPAPEPAPAGAPESSPATPESSTTSPESSPASLGSSPASLEPSPITSPEPDPAAPVFLPILAPRLERAFTPTGTWSPAPAGARVGVRVRLGSGVAPQQGRLLVTIAPADAVGEPRLAVDDTDATAQVFGMDVAGWAPGQAVELAGDVRGYPRERLADLPAGAYRVQALLHRYETFRRGDGRVVDLPPDRGEGQRMNDAPGNLYSLPTPLQISPGSAVDIELALDQEVPPLVPMVDVGLQRHVELVSPRLSTFWGRPTKLGARVLLPVDWGTHPDAHYPLVIYHSHFSRDLAGYRDSPPDPGLPPIDVEGLRRDCPDGHGPACAGHGYERYMQQASYEFHKLWTGPKFPRVLLVQIEHANPYYDDSYAVNSQNIGPYGDAITFELIPEIERRFRGLGTWARGMYGGSTGGWEALAVQVLYPGYYNGAVGNCPDPLDFRAYMTIDLYADANAYRAFGPFRESPRISSRGRDGVLRSTVEQDNLLELALGTRSRSGQQFDAWEAVFSPVGPDGYPRRIFDKTTGAIDPAVAAHWRERHDLGHIITRDWPRIGKELAGKLWINVGDMDTYFLDRAVRLFEARLNELTAPFPDAQVNYGHGHGHCWSGDPLRANFESRMTYHARFIPLLVAHFLETAPPDADTTSWRY